MDLTQKCILQYLCQDNDSSPAVRSAVEGNFSFVNDDGDFDNSELWTKEAGWSVSGGLASFSYYLTERIYQTKSITQGRRYQTAFQLASRAANAVAVYIGGAVGTYRNSVGFYNEEIAGGTSNQYVGLKTQAAGNLACDNLFVWDKIVYPRTGVLSGAARKTNSISVLPGKVQARCFNLAAGDCIFINQIEVYPFVTDIVMWINPNSLTSRQGLIRFGSGLDVVIDTDSKVKFFAGGVEYPMEPENHLFIKVNNGSGNTLSSGWNFVWISLGTMGQQFMNCQFCYQQTNYYSGKAELIEGFKPLEGNVNLTDEQVAFLWNGGSGTTKLKSAGVVGRVMTNNLLGD